MNGYRGVLPGSSKPAESEGDTDNGTSCRTRSFNRSGFRKRKLLQTSNLHTISKKAAKSRYVLFYHLMFIKLYNFSYILSLIIFKFYLKLVLP